MINPFNQKTHPNTFEAYQYAEQVVNGDIIACIYIIGSCKRFLDDLKECENPNSKYIFDLEYAERYLRLVQNFNHVIGTWETPNIKYNPWQKWVWANALGFKHRNDLKRPKYRTLHVEVPRGASKAHPLDEIVPTPDGIKRWSEIEIGSRLYSRDGSICRVIGKTPIIKQKSYLVKFSDGSEIKCSEGHLWITSSKPERDRENHHKANPPKRRDKFGNIIGDTKYESPKTAIEIKKTLKYGGETNHLIKNTKPVYGDFKLPYGLDPYFIGYWVGNGGKNGSRVTCHEDDSAEICKLFSDRGIEVSGISPKLGTKGVTINVLNLLVPMRDYGLIDKTKHFKEEWLLMSKEDRLELLRGLLDSDGTGNQDSSVHFYTSEYDVAVGVRRLANSLGYRAVIRINKVSETNNFKTDKTHYTVAFTPRGEDKVFNLKRKYDRQLEVRGNYSYCDKRYILDVFDLGYEEDMFCVEVDSKDHTYLIGDGYIPTHNSTMASQCALYFLGLDPSRSGEKLAVFATKSDQSRIILDAARAMASKSPNYLKATGIEVLAHKIVDQKNFSEMVAMSADSKSMDGLNLRVAFCDELHAMERSLFEVVVSGQKKRKDSLTICCTTAGFNTDSVGYEQSLYAKKVAKGEVKDDTFFSAVYTIDEGDDIFSETTWKKANPNYGFSVDPIAFEATAEKAKVTPSDVPNFKVKSLNIWISESNAYFDVGLWNKCADESLTIDQFFGEKCYVGIDLASKIDLTSFAILFRKDNIYYYFDKTYVPEDTFNKARSAVYENALNSNNLIITPGEAIFYPKLEEDFVALSKKVNIISGLFDPWNAVSFSQNMIKERIDMKEFRMTTANLSEATKTLDALIRQGRIRHNGSPLTSWCLGNVVAKEDPAGNVFPKKSSDRLKIDPIVALIMALAAWMQEDQEDSVYETRGPIFL